MKKSTRILPLIFEDECSCSEFQYTPDEDLEIHKENAIRHLCQGIHSHEHGIPEWVKNSADAYARIDAPESKRIIVLIFDYGRKNESSSISCLDFVGMTSSDVEEYFRHWADPEAARGGKEKRPSIQGGHGNGGKCYMVQMFNEFAYLHTVKINKRNLYGVRGGSVRFGYIPDQEKGKDFSIDSLKEELNNALGSFRFSVDTLPKAAIETVNSVNGFSIFTGYGPKGYDNKIPTKQLVRSLLDHPQMIRSLETCKIYVIINGKLEYVRRPLTLLEITQIKGAEKPIEIEIPSKLKDPAYDRTVSTTEDGKLYRGKLILFTSEKNMSYGLKVRHTIRYVSDKFGDFGYVGVSSLDIQSPYKTRIYGVCHLEALEQYKQNVRAELADSPVTRAVQEFIAEEIQKYAQEFEKRDSRKYDQKEKSAISKMNEFLDKWKNRFLKEKLGSLWGLGEETTETERTYLPIGKVARIELTLSHQKAGKGIYLRPVLRFFNESGEKIRSVPYEWISEDNNVAMVDDNLMIIQTFSFGKTKISAKILEGNIRSNSVPLEVVHIKKIRILPEIVELPEGGRQRLQAICKLDDGSETDQVHLAWDEDNPSIAQVSTAGFVFGFKQGETKVVAWDDNCMPSNPALVKVISGEGIGPGKKRGKGYPLVLISGDFDPDPETGEFVPLSPDDPPVHQRAQDWDRNIWWINSAAPLAALYLDKEKGYGSESSEWRMYHLECHIDIMVQILLIHSQTDKEPLSVKEWIDKWMYQVSEIQPIACSELHKFLISGDLSSE